jgi:hypothetical protein
MVKRKACPCLTDQLGVNRVGLLPSRWTSGVPRSTGIVRPGEPVRFVPRPNVSPYSITSSASSCIEIGHSIPSVLAVFILMTNSNFVGCLTGRSAGLLALEDPASRTPVSR